MFIDVLKGEREQVSEHEIGAMAFDTLGKQLLIVTQLTREDDVEESWLVSLKWDEETWVETPLMALPWNTGVTAMSFDKAHDRAIICSENEVWEIQM